MTSNTEIKNEPEKKSYHAPNLTDYGKMSELTQTMAGDTGDDFGPVPSSYTASSFATF